MCDCFLFHFYGNIFYYVCTNTGPWQVVGEKLTYWSPTRDDPSLQLVIARQHSHVVREPHTRLGLGVCLATDLSSLWTQVPWEAVPFAFPAGSLVVRLYALLTLRSLLFLGDQWKASVHPKKATPEQNFTFFPEPRQVTWWQPSPTSILCYPPAKCEKPQTTFKVQELKRGTFNVPPPLNF